MLLLGSPITNQLGNQVKRLLIILSILLLSPPLFGQSSEEKQFIFSSNIFVNTFSYILNKQNTVGAHFGKVSTEIDEDNIEKAETMFLGVNYMYTLDCLECDSIFILPWLGRGKSIYTTNDGSTYTYSRLDIYILGGYRWYFENDLSVQLAMGPSFLNASKKSESVKSNKGYGSNVEDRLKKRRFMLINPTPFLLIGYTF
jgi:hypothetical protein